MESSKPTQPTSNKSVEERYLPGDLIPVAEAIETDSDSVWAMWQDSNHEPKPIFDETLPMALEDMPPIRKT